MRRKFLSLALCLMMVLSLIAVPASAEGEVTLLESWFEKADGTRVYDTTKAVAAVKPAFYVNNTKAEAIVGAKLILASYNAQNKLEAVNFAAAPDIATGESKVTTAETVEVFEGGKTYMMVWDGAYAPIVPKTELTTVSNDASIISFKVGEVEGKITNEYYYRTTSASNYSYEKSILVTLPAASTENLTAIAPTIVLAEEGATVSPASRVSQDFSEGKTVNYTVTAADGVTKQTYTVAIAKNDLKVYSEGASAAIDFPDYDDVNAATPKTSTANYSSAWTDTYYNSTYDHKERKHKWSITANAKSKLYYTGKQIANGKYVLVGDEQLTDKWYDSEGVEVTVVEGETDTSSLRKYVVTYAADDTEKTNPTYTLMSGLRLIADPTNSENLVLRYDKRSSVVQANPVTSFYGPAETTITKTELSNINYTFKLYVPKTTEATRYMALALWVQNGKDYRTNPSFRILTGLSGNDLQLRLTATASDGVVLTTVKNGLNKWLNIAVDIDVAKKEAKLYCDNEHIGTTNIFLATPSTTLYNSNGYQKHLMSFSARDTSSFGSLLVDDINVEVQYAPVAE